jgi:hypothetical protein
LIYRATKHGFNPKEFHRKCNKIGATLVIIKAKTDKGVDTIIGGYTDIPW